jgi:hypothetical protein
LILSESCLPTEPANRVVHSIGVEWLTVWLEEHVPRVSLAPVKRRHVQRRLDRAVEGRRAVRDVASALVAIAKCLRRSGFLIIARE